MLTLFKHLLLCAILYSKLRPHATSYIHQIIEINIDIPLKFNFTFFSKELKGVILHCIDSKRYQFGIKIIEGKNENIFSLQNNARYINRRLKLLCGCDPCNNASMHLYIELRKNVIYVACNRNIRYSFHTTDFKKTAYSYPIPMVIVNKTETLYITMGNIGPYVSDSGKMIFPVKDQMVGCLETFLFESRHVKFDQVGTDMKPLCPKNCINNICNGGLCVEGIIDGYNCDCASTALNGRYCNNSLKNYNEGGNNSFENINAINGVYIKMTWKQSSTKEYCLMEIIDGYKHNTISINKSTVLLNYVVISSLNINDTNFVIVNIINNSMIIKTKNTIHTKEYQYNKTIRINVGFTEKSDLCVIFEGLYDIHFHLSQLRQTRSLKASTNDSLKHGRLPQNKNWNQVNFYLLSIILGGSLSFIIVQICVTIVIVYLRKRKKKMIGNAYDDEYIDLVPRNTRRHVTDDTDVYSSINYNNIYGPHTIQEDDSSDYVLPTVHSTLVISPPLPPRNIT